MQQDSAPGAVEAETTEGADKAPGASLPRRRPLTPKRAATGRAYLADPTEHSGTLMVRAGFKPSSARNPAQNLDGQTPRDLAHRVLQEQAEGVTLSTLERKALKTLDVVLSRDDPGQTEVTAAGGLLRLKREFGEDEDPHALTSADLRNAERDRLRLVRLGILMVERRGIEGALALLDRASVRKLGLHFHELPRAFVDLDPGAVRFRGRER